MINLTAKEYIIHRFTFQNRLAFIASKHVIFICPYIPAKESLFIFGESKDALIDMFPKETMNPFIDTLICIIYVKNVHIQKSLHLKIICKRIRH